MSWSVVPDIAPLIQLKSYQCCSSKRVTCLLSTFQNDTLCWQQHDVVNLRPVCSQLSFLCSFLSKFLLRQLFHVFCLCRLFLSVVLTLVEVEKDEKFSICISSLSQLYGILFLTSRVLAVYQSSFVSKSEEPLLWCDIWVRSESTEWHWDRPQWNIHLIHPSFW